MKSIIILSILLISRYSIAQQPPEKYEKIWMELHEGNTEKAVKDLRKIIKKEKTDPWPYWMLGIALNHGQATDEEREYFKQSIDIDSTFAPGHYSYAISLDSQDSTKFATIEYHFNKAILYSKPEDNFYLEPRARFYYDQKRYDEAIADAKKHISLNPDNRYFANQVIVQSLYAQGKKDELKKFLVNYNPQNEAGPEDPEYYYFLGTVYEEFGNKQKTCLYFTQAVADQEFYIELFGTEEGFKVPDWFESVKKKIEKCR